MNIGAEVLRGGGVRFRVWAPRCRRVEIVIGGGDGEEEGYELTREANDESPGYFSGKIDRAGDGTRYWYRLDGGERLFPDPASRFQPEGPHGPSQVIDPGRFAWADDGWRGLKLAGQIIYELHIGTFTREGTWEAAARELAELADLGVTVLNVMPVADFPGRFGWGYDGVNLFAPKRLYGEPDDLRRFVDRAHRLGLAVILDVVYNHLGPDGNYLREFSESYFSNRHRTDWGEAINFDGEQSGPVRDYFLANAGYWVEEFHIDGLRLDATHSIYDDSQDNILGAIGRRVREAAGGRATIVVAEDDLQRVRLVQARESGGFGLDGVWNDDFHHSSRVALAGRNEAYLSGYRGKPQEFISAFKYGYLYQGQWNSWKKGRRGTADFRIPHSAFVICLQNHDQIANSGRGERCHLLSSPGRYRALTALLLLAPCTPMLFQGQEFASSSPFIYFADFEGELKQLVREGRFRTLAEFRSLATAEGQAALADPGDPETFNRCKLDFSERRSHAGIYRMHRD
ncbi:MAG: malto-oligosyltrehalose trehalohydrolase, partial [Blastocatellia bacterium]|nr:malto-oligosyltrehalose trehalohydrolase [Blastocatellia bacterium]